MIKNNLKPQIYHYKLIGKVSNLIYIIFCFSRTIFIRSVFKKSCKALRYAPLELSKI